MTKMDLIEAVKETGLSKKQATAAVEAVLSAIKNTLASGGKVQLVGFGTFSVKTKAARTGRNPKTGEVINIPAKKVPVFKAGKALKDAVQ